MIQYTYNNLTIYLNFATKEKSPRRWFIAPFCECSSFLIEKMISTSHVFIYSGIYTVFSAWRRYLQTAWVYMRPDVCKLCGDETPCPACLADTTTLQGPPNDIHTGRHGLVAETADHCCNWNSTQLALYRALLSVLGINLINSAASTLHTHTRTHAGARVPWENRWNEPLEWMYKASLRLSITHAGYFLDEMSVDVYNIASRARARSRNILMEWQCVATCIIINLRNT